MLLKIFSLRLSVTYFYQLKRREKIFEHIFLILISASISNSYIHRCENVKYIVLIHFGKCLYQKCHLNKSCGTFQGFITTGQLREIISELDKRLTEEDLVTILSNFFASLAKFSKLK
jgi:hypothetical protein